MAKLTARTARNKTRSRMASRPSRRRRVQGYKGSDSRTKSE